MDDNERKYIVDIIKSDEVRQYFLEMFKGVFDEISSAEGEHLQEENSKLEKKNKSLEKKINNKEIEINNLKDEYENNIIELKRLHEDDICEERKVREHLSEQLLEYQYRFKGLNEVFSCYQYLSEESKTRLNNIFKNDNIYSIVVAICNWNNIEGLWQYTKQRIINDELDDVDGLVRLFDKSFEVYSCFDENKTYGLINPDIGERYDSDKQNIKGTKTDGLIENVLLPGIYNITSNEIIYKAIVEIE